MLAKHRWAGTTPTKGSDGSITYPATAVNIIKAALGQPHRDPDPANDWLSQYLKETP